MSLLWLALGATHLWWGLRLQGDAGRTRFAQLSEERAVALHQQFATRTGSGLLLMGAAFALLDLAVRVVDGEVWQAGVSVAAVVVLAAAWLVRRRTEPDVSAAFDERGLEPAPRQDASATRVRRQKQFGFLSLAAYAVGTIAAFVHTRHEGAALLVVSAVATLVAFVALLGVGWASVWVYGDEQKAEAGGRG